MKVGKIYVLGVRRRPDVSKVGMTTGDVDDRVGALQTGNPDEIYAHTVFTLYDTPLGDVKDVERFCHQLLTDYRMKGEWFNIAPEDAAAIINEELQAKPEKEGLGLFGWLAIIIAIWFFFSIW
ncbi:MAG: GIY-YIG nuclease family protein [Hyphomicrobiales bacterium]|nr:GIY-YIG nuclease family protein [Hyphomicrobiales bacterium]MCY4038122.1 GIY-YIG nuclease family protein [Hyphomicrobiales bacterium]